MDSRRYLVSFLLLFGFLFLRKTTSTKFNFPGFGDTQEKIVTNGVGTITSDGLLRLTGKKQDTSGTAFYREPVKLLETKKHSTNPMVRSFSTCFVFAILPTSSSNGGYGFTFTLSPTPNRTGAESGQYLGLLNRETDGNPRSHVFAVEFDTAQGFKDGLERSGNHIGLNFNSLKSKVQEVVAYHDNDDPQRKEDFMLQSGDPILALLDYDGPSQTLNLTVYPANLKSRPIKPLISEAVPNLSQIVQEVMYVGFTAATGKKFASAHYLMGWSFSSDGEHPVAAMLNLSDLPRRPLNTEKKKGYNSKDIALIVALSILTLILIASLVFFIIYKKRVRQHEVLEQWEINQPHRLRYKDLYVATDKFSKDRIIGKGGFGTVFRGSLSSSSSDEVAVKRVTPDSLQGINEFVAEIESLGQLSHKNLVKLRGWSKHKKELLIIYDFIPQGSLERLLYRVLGRGGGGLCWDVRYSIAKGISCGLTYLHEGCHQIIVHRDIKASNVLIDDDMSPRLSDFGLARFWERGSQTHTTVVVGTPGYMAPEVTRNGNFSPASDVFAFGVLLLEIVCGRRPTDFKSFFLPDWVFDFHASGHLLEAVDPN